jgi:DNA (cytosine-5)-methyltransferase 3A
MKIVSLFDGMSCLQIALKEHGFIVDQYYASEIDKFAIKQTQHNFPDTIQLGSVTDWKTWDIDWSSIDLIGAGSPCQGFSFAGKQLAFDDPRSKLFFVFVEILNHCRKFNPEVRFLLENVDMKKDYLRIISEYVGIFPTKINSALVSAQNRERWYWTNIRTKEVGLFDELYTDIPQPINEGILLRDILQPENEVDNKYYLDGGHLEWWNKNKEFQLAKKYSQLDGEKAICLTARSYDSWNGNYITLFPYRQDRPININNDKFNTLRSDAGGVLSGVGIDTGIMLRKLTPIECSRLQTIPEWYKWIVSDSQIYRMLGNGWTVKVIQHIMSFYELKINLDERGSAGKALFPLC